MSMLPGISDRPDQIAEVVRAARGASACGIWTNFLFPRAPEPASISLRIWLATGRSPKDRGDGCPSTE
jgi:hypothetical protein